MVYAALQESIRLVNGEAPAQALRLSRRTRHLPVAVDRDGDVAATLFLRRGVSGDPWLDVHALERSGTSWRAEIATLVLPTREIDIAEHGVAIVVWAARRPPSLVAVDRRGRQLGQIPIGQR